MTSADAHEDSSLLRAAKSGSAIGLLQIAYAVCSFVLSLNIAATFGAASSTDAYFMASSTAELLAKILLGGALASVFLPIFIEHSTHGDPERAWRLFRSLFTLALGAFVVLGFFVEMVARPLVDILAPGFPPDVRAVTVFLLRIAFPAYLFSFLTDLATVPLHAHRRFSLPAAGRLIAPLLTLGILLFLGRWIGIVTLALGLLFGAALQMILLLNALRRSGFIIRLSAPWKNIDVWHTLRLTLPFVLSILAAYGAGAVYRILVSGEPAGSLASLKFAEKISQMANLLFVGTITQIAFPAFARVAALGSAEEIRARVGTAVRVVAFFAIPLTIGITLLRTPLVRMLYERGAFTPAATTATSLLVPLYLLGLLGNGWSSLLGHLTLALKETRRAVGVNVALQALAAALFVLLVPSLGVPGLALVSGAGPFLLTALYLFTLKDRCPGLIPLFFTKTMGALVLAGVACGVGVAAGQKTGLLFPPGFVRDLGTLFGSALLGAAAYLGAAQLLGVPEVATVRVLARHALVKLTQRTS